MNFNIKQFIKWFKAKEPKYQTFSALEQPRRIDYTIICFDNRPDLAIKGNHYKDIMLAALHGGKYENGEDIIMLRGVRRVYVAKI